MPWTRSNVWVGVRVVWREWLRAPSNGGIGRLRYPLDRMLDLACHTCPASIDVAPNSAGIVRNWPTSLQARTLPQNWSYSQHIRPNLPFGCIRAQA